MKRFPRCSCVAKDGTQCSRRVTDGSNPPICHIHRGLNGGIAQPADLDEVDIIRKLARSGNDSVRLRAVELLLELKKDDGCPECLRRRKSEVDIRFLSPDQKDELNSIFRRVHEIKSEAKRYQSSGLPAFSKSVEEQEAEYAAVTTAIATPEPEPAPAPPSKPKVEPAPEPLVSPADYAVVGLYVENGVVTHPLGDDHARKVLDGTISFEEAKRQQDVALEEARDAQYRRPPR